MTHRDRAGDPPGRREAAGDAGHRQDFPTPPPNRPLPVRLRDRNGGFPRAFGQGADGVPHGLRCPASPRHALLAESLGKPPFRSRRRTGSGRFDEGVGKP